MVALLGGNGNQDETSFTRPLSSISRQLQFANGQWYPNPCSWGTHLYCWSWQPGVGYGVGNGEAVDDGWHDDAWSANDDAGWSHYDDFYHNDDGQEHDDGYHVLGQAILDQNDDYNVDDQYWHDDYYQNAPNDDDDYVYSYEPVPEASIIKTPNGGYGGRRGRSLCQIRFNKCPPVIPGYATTSWRYKPSELRYLYCVGIPPAVSHTHT
jgi:hypothetical protein